MVEIEGNLLTPNHVVARGEGEWSTAGALAGFGSELPRTLAHVYNRVYNIKLQEGGQVELGNKVYAATLGARLDSTDPGQDPTYYVETTKHLHDLTGYPSGHIHWAFGTASVDQHGMPSLYARPSAPSEIGTELLLDKEILGARLISLRGPEASAQDRTDLQSLRDDLRHWTRSLIPHTPTRWEVNRWSQVSPRDRGVSCFHTSNMVRIYSTIPGAPQYRRMDELRKLDKLWTRQHRHHRMDPNRGQISIVECVMTFACPQGDSQWWK